MALTFQGGWLGWRGWWLAWFVFGISLVAQGAAGPAAASQGEVSFAGDPLERWHRVELEWVRSVQGEGRWGLPMRWISELGPGPIAWAILGALFLGGHPRRATRMAVFVLLALWIRECLALAIQSPRPYWLDPSLQAFGDVATRRATYSFPSGHALVGTAFWWYLAAELRRPSAWVAAVVVPTAIAYSRVYLAVHYPSDVTAGMFCGAAYTVIFRILMHPVGRWLAVSGVGSRRPPVVVGACVAIAVGMVAAGWAVRAWVLGEPVPAGWLRYGTDARRVGVFALVGASFLAVAVGWMLAGPRIWAWLEHPGFRVRQAARMGIAATVVYSIVRAANPAAMTFWFPHVDGFELWAVRLLFGLGGGFLVWWLLPGCLPLYGGAGKGGGRSEDARRDADARRER